MGSFWGLDNAGKEAQGWPREYGAYQSQAYKDWLAQKNKNISAAESASTWNKDYNLRRAEQGVGDTTDIRDIGKRIMPGVDDYVTAKRGRIQDETDAFEKLPSADETMDKINRATSDKGEYIRQTRDANLTDIGDTYHRGMASEQEASDYVTKDLTDRYDSLRANTRDAYGKLKASADESWGKQLANSELLKPGSQFQQAQTARSFAGQQAGATAALRRMGVDPNSPQAFAAMQRVATARSRAMDDAAAAGTDKYLAMNNEVLRGREGDRQKLGLGELDTDTALSVDQGTGLRNNAVRHSGVNIGLDQTRGTAVRGQNNDTLDRTSDWLDEGARNALTNKMLHTQDWQTRAALADKMSDAELESIGLHRSEFDAGMDFRLKDLSERNAGADRVGQYGENQYSHAYSAANEANASGDRAMGAYKTAYEYEAPQAGYGLKMIAAAAAPAVAMIPGAGPILSAGMQGVAGIPQAPGSQGGGYSSGGGSAAPGTQAAPTSATPGGNQPQAAGTRYNTTYGQPGGTGGWQNLYNGSKSLVDYIGGKLRKPAGTGTMN